MLLKHLLPPQLFLFLFTTGIFISSKAQDDDLADYRTKRETFIKITDKAIRSDLATFTMAGIDESISKLPLEAVPAVAKGTDSIMFQKENLAVIIKAGRFDASKHKIMNIDERVVKIDNKPYYGNYGKQPAKTIESVTVIFNNNDTLKLPPEAYKDLYQPDFSYTDATGSVRSHNGVFLSADKHRFYIYMLNKELTGRYEVTWVLQDKQYLRRVVDTNILK